MNTITLCVLFCFLFFSLCFSAEDFKPTRSDLVTANALINQIPYKTKLIIISDTQHRLPNTRAATLLMAQALAKRYPKEKICLFFETTEKVDSYWTQFKQSDGSESAYQTFFEPVSRKISSSVDGLSSEKAARVFVEPSYFMASYLKEKVPNISIYGVDVDYADKSTFSLLYNNAKSPRSLSDNEFAKKFIAERNENMAKKATDHLRTRCSRAILSAGNRHVDQWIGDKKTFPKYSGEPIPGIVNLVDKKVTKEPVIINLTVTADRICPEGQARIEQETCKIEFSCITPHYFDVQLPKDFFVGHAQMKKKKDDSKDVNK